MASNPNTSTSSAQFGLALSSPVTQTILPVIENMGSSALVLGFFPIAKTTFQGTETTFALSSGSVGIQSYTIADRINSGHGLDGIPQYMAMVLSYRQATDRIYLGYTDFVNAGNDGYFSSWVMPSRDWMQRYNAGALLSSLQVGMATQNYAIPSNPSNPSADNGTLTWATSVDLSTNGSQCAFFDFNWLDLFNSSPVATNKGQVIPLSISTASNPAGGYFKATYIADKPTIVPGGAQMFTTIRIIRLQQDVPAGNYTFTFTISYTENSIQASTNVNLTLTVV